MAIKPYSGFKCDICRKDYTKKELFPQECHNEVTQNIDIDPGFTFKQTPLNFVIVNRFSPEGHSGSFYVIRDYEYSLRNEKISLEGMISLIKDGEVKLLNDEELKSAISHLHGIKDAYILKNTITNPLYNHHTWFKEQIKQSQ
ncbi:MAG: hypothetical protein OQK82_07245 [Candidatus Pacearchaeota archaeon]|nr:hypothetical protein [Candidatus Pacearchaeota archaeon]